MFVLFLPVKMCNTYLDLSRTKSGAEEGIVLDVLPPQPRAELVQLLHAHRGQLAGERATAARSAANGIRCYSQVRPNGHTHTHTPAGACRGPK